jgi:hypothetical protein
MRETGSWSPLRVVLVIEREFEGERDEAQLIPL